MGFLVMLGFIIAVNWLCLTLVWLISLKIKDVGIVDIYWGIGSVSYTHLTLPTSDLV